MEKKKINLRVTQKQNLSSDLLRNWVWHWNSFPTAATTEVFFFFLFSIYFTSSPSLKLCVQREFCLSLHGTGTEIPPLLIFRVLCEPWPPLWGSSVDSTARIGFTANHGARGREEKKPGAAPDAFNPLPVRGPAAARSFFGPGAMLCSVSNRLCVVFLSSCSFLPPLGAGRFGGFVT